MKQILLTLLCLLAGAAFSQADKVLKQISSDLPDETEGTEILDKNEIQLETSLLNARFPSGTQPSIVQALLRYGLFEKAEVRLLVEDGHARDRYIEETVESTYPLALSTKIQLLKGHHLLPDITFVAYLKLPYTSRSEEQSIYWSPIAALTFQNKIGEKLSLEYTGGVQQEAYSAEWLSSSSASLHYQFIPSWEIFAEYYGQYKPGEGPMHNAGLGSCYQFNDYFGIYIVGGKSFSSSPENSFVSFGIMLRR